jgi:hypothetical protein
VVVFDLVLAMDVDRAVLAGAARLRPGTIHRVLLTKYCINRRCRRCRCCRSSRAIGSVATESKRRTASVNSMVSSVVVMVVIGIVDNMFLATKQKGVPTYRHEQYRWPFFILFEMIASRFSFDR